MPSGGVEKQEILTHYSAEYNSELLIEITVSSAHLAMYLMRSRSHLRR